VKLHLAADLALPLDACTQTFLVVGKRGSGKTNTCGRLAEQLHHAKLPFVVVDPVDSWWGLKAAQDGRGPGLDVYVFGGSHADLPLEATGGSLVADVVIENRISAILSIKHFSGRERSRFVSDFADRLFRKNAGEPVHLFLEEAHEVAPQQIPKREGAEEMLGRVTRIWKLGRSSGIGGSAITQRPASLSKNITTQAEILIVHRLIGPQDVAAIKEWIKYHGESEEILPTLSGLKTGEAWVWAPDFPESAPIGLRRVQILKRETFDSSATPTGHRVEPRELAPVDIAGISSKMAATIERAKAEDPKELRRRIAELERALVVAEKKAAVEPIVTQRVEVPVLALDIAVRLTRDAGAIQAAAEGMARTAAEIAAGVQRAQAAGEAATRRPIAAPAPVRAAVPRQAPHARATQPRQGGPAPAENGRLPVGERRILTAIAQYPEGASREQLTILTGYKRSSRDTYLQRLGARGLVDAAGGGMLMATGAGMAALGDDFEPLPTGAALQSYWLDRLPEGERRILAILIGAYPRAVQRPDLDEATGYKRSSRDTYLQRLGSRRLITAAGPGEVRASEGLFG